MIEDFLKKTRQKPDSEKKKIIFFIAGIVTASAFLFSFIVSQKIGNQTLSKKSQPILPIAKEYLSDSFGQLKNSLSNGKENLGSTIETLQKYKEVIGTTTATTTSDTTENLNMLVSTSTNEL